MSEPTGDASTVLPPPDGVPRASEPRDTLTPEQLAIAEVVGRHVATLVVAAMEPRIDALDRGLVGVHARLDQLDANDLATKKSLDGIHETLGREVVRIEGVRSALGTLSNDMLEQKYISDKARGEVADQLAMMPKPKPPSHAPAPAEAKGGE